MVEDFHVTIEGVRNDPPDPPSSDVVISNLNTNLPIDAGDPLDFDISMFNTGSSSVSVQPTVEVSDETLTGSNELVPSSDTITQTVTWNTTAGDTGSFVATILVDQDSQEKPFSIDAGSSGISITITSTTSPAGQGGSMDFDVKIENSKSIDQIVTAELFID